MRRFAAAFPVLVLCGGSVGAQVDFPSNPLVGPKKYETRKVGGGIDPGAKVNPAISEGGMVQYVTHIILHDLRVWTSADGRTIQARLIAFEDLKAETSRGDPPPKMPDPPLRPTIVKNGKVRLLMGEKPVEVVLESLSIDDREFVDRMAVAIAMRLEKPKK